MYLLPCIILTPVKNLHTLNIPHTIYFFFSFLQANKINLDGKIVYSIEQTNCPFSINSETGNIYPLTYHSNDEDVKFTVLAKGTANGKNVEGKQEVTVSYFLISLTLVPVSFRLRICENRVFFLSFSSPKP